MIVVRKVYNGYTEKILNGSELRNLFSNSFYCSGRHHSAIYDLSVNNYLNLLKINDDDLYRIFYNDSFCKIMKTNDKNVGFFGHISLRDMKPDFSQKVCPLCNGDMVLKDGRYGLFWSCSSYPECKGAQKINIIGNISLDSITIYEKD